MTRRFSPMRFALHGLFSGLGFAGRRAARRWILTPTAPETVLAETSDGWALPLMRLRREPSPRRGPILLQHGLAGNGVAFLIPGFSLAEQLAEDGFDVFVSNLRGTPGSRPPGPARRWRCCLDDYVDRDLPAILSRVRELSGPGPILWLGQSLGGVLAYMYGIRHGCEELGGVVALCSSLDYRLGENQFQKLMRFRGLLRHLPYVPAGALARLALPLDAIGLLRADRFNHHPENVDRVLARRFLSSVVTDISVGLLESLATTFDDGGFRSADGLVYREAAERFTAPLLALGGDADNKVSAEAIRATVALVGSEDKTLRIFGREHGDRASYGHVDFLVGRSAREEAWPLIRSWLEERSRRPGV